MNMMQALIPSTILTLIVSALVGHFGSAHAFLNLQNAEIGGYAIHWSWTLFFIAMAINGGLVLLRRGQDEGEPEGAALEG